MLWNLANLLAIKGEKKSFNWWQWNLERVPLSGNSSFHFEKKQGMRIKI
jgi:hypothetical protein